MKAPAGGAALRIVAKPRTVEGFSFTLAMIVSPVDVSGLSAAVVSTAPATTSQMAEPAPSLSTTQPPTRLAAMKLSDPHSRMRP